MSLTQPPTPLTDSTMTKDEFLGAVAETKEHIVAGDVFQLVLSHRFQRSTFADPFDVYRALRVVNPSPYMIYLQARGSIIVASSPEILCRTDKSRTVVNRPLAGTRMRGKTKEEDDALELDLLADEKAGPWPILYSPPHIQSRLHSSSLSSLTTDRLSV